MNRTFTRVAAVAGAAILSLAATVAVAQPAPPGVPVATGLTQPRGLTEDGDAILVAELGAGRIVSVAADGSTTTVVEGLPNAVFFSEETGTDEAAGPSAVLPVDGGYVLTISEGPEAESTSTSSSRVSAYSGWVAAS